MALRKRIWRILSEHRGRYIGIFVLIFLGSFSFLWFRAFSGNYARLVNVFAQSNVQEDVSFTSHHPIADILSLERQINATIDPYRFYDAALPEDRELRLIEATHKVNLPAVLTGRILENSGEILLSPVFYDAGGYQLGDTIDIGGYRYRVVGTVALPSYVFPIKYVNDIMPPPGFGLGVISPEDMDAFADAKSVYAVHFADRVDIKGQVTALYNLLPQQGIALSEWMDASMNKRIRMPWATISGMNAMSVPIPAAMFLLCCLIVGMMVWRMVRAESAVIGMLYAQGYRRKELLAHYLSVPLLIAAAAGFAGVLLAAPTIGPTIQMMADLYYIVPYDRAMISPLDIALGLLLPVAFLGIACWAVIHKELRKSPAELMKGGRQTAKVNALERGLKLRRLPFPIKFKVREQIRSLPRLLFLLFGVMSASFLMLAGFTINHSMTTVFSGGDVPYHYAWEYSFQEMKRGEPAPGAAPFHAIRCHFEDRETAEFYLNGIPSDVPHIYDFVDAQGREVPKDQVNITSLLANRLKLGVGDAITVVNQQDGKRHHLVIDAIVETYVGQFIYMPLADFNHMLGLPEDSYSGVFSKEAIDYSPDELSGVKDLQNMANAMEELLLPMMMVVIGMTVVAAVIGVIIIFLVTSLTIEESRASISLLKILGYHPKEVKGLVLGGLTPVVILGFLLGIPLMMSAINAMYRYLGEMINLALPIILSPLYVTVSFCLIYTVYLFTKWFCGRRLAAIPMSGALKAGAE